MKGECKSCKNTEDIDEDKLCLPCLKTLSEAYKDYLNEVIEGNIYFQQTEDWRTWLEMELEE